MSSLDTYYESISTTDTKKKISVGLDIVNYLGDPNSSIECEDMGAFIDGMVPWMQSSNFKVSISSGIAFFNNHPKRAFIELVPSLK